MNAIRGPTIRGAIMATIMGYSNILRSKSRKSKLSCDWGSGQTFGFLVSGTFVGFLGLGLKFNLSQST